ncbi:MAG: tetratricopeptide repeat protein [Ignavibacteria bacterium]|nr:tetratricopeptide repeat protein [Ignavibacteria bacterium]
MSGIFRMCYVLLLLMVCVGVRQLSAQKQGQAKVDSLISSIEATKNDTARVRLLLNIAFFYHTINPDEGIKYGRQALALTEKMKWEAGTAHANLNIGVNYLNKSDVIQAISYYFKALKINEKIGEKAGMSMCYTNLGGLYHSKGDYSESLKYYEKALQINIEMNSKLDVGINLGNIGEVYRLQKKYRQALEFYEKSSVIFEEFGDQYGIARTLINTGIVYSEQGNINKAIEITLKSYKISLALDNKETMSSSLGNIAWYYYMLAKDTANSTASKKKDHLRKSIEFSLHAITIAKEFKNINFLQSHYETLSAVYQLSGDYKNALETYLLYTAAKDSMTAMHSTETISKIENKRALELKDKALEITQLALEKKRNESIFYISGIILLLGAMVFIFRERRKSERERDKSDKLLLNILPAEITHELKERGATTAKNYDSVSVLFTDFVDFTSASETMESQQLVEELHTCFMEFDRIITQYNIEKIKTIGDAYLAVCGLPISNENHAENVVRAALEIQAFMKKRYEILGAKTFQIRIGINSGSVVAGIVGVKKFAYDIWGDTVNTAARMEQHSEAGKINISESTYELVKDRFTCEYRGEIDAKNKGMLKMYFVEKA